MSAVVAPTRPRRRTWAAVVAASLLATGLALTEAGTVQADPVIAQPGELVVNGGGEQPVTVGWTGGLGRATHGAGGYPGSVIVGPSGATGATYPGGTALLTGSGGASVATQTIDLSPSAAAIDNGNVDALLSAYLGGYTTQSDNARLSYDFRNQAGVSLDTVVFGPVLPADRNNVSGFVPFAETLRLPAGTRQVVLTITTQRFVAPANDGYIDNVSLILDAPSPVANPDTATTDQGIPVTLTPPSNDTPGAGADLVPTSVRLLDGVTETTTLTTAQGTYTVDPTSGNVLFSPIASFFGTTTPVPYRITDSSGQRDDSTLTITVDFVAAPGLSVVKSASPADPAAFTLGTVVTYSFVVTNTGNVGIDDIEINEAAFTGTGTLPDPVCAATSLAPGAQTTCTTTYTLTASDVAALGVSNTATVTGIPAGFATPLTSDPSSVTLPITPAPAISLTKTVDAAGASEAGDPLAYSFLVTNTGNVAVNSVEIAEVAFSGTGTLPDASCPAGSLLPGAATTCTVGYQLTQDDVDAGTVTNTAIANAVPASGGTVSSAPSSAPVTITAQPSFTFAKTATPASITAAGQPVTYSFTITNTGNVTLSSPVIDDIEFNGAGTLGAVSCPSATVAPGTALVCSAGYTTVTADLGDATLSNSATADVDDPSGTTLTSELSTVSIPIVLPDPAAPGPTPAADDEIAVTGVDPTMPVLVGAGLLLAGLALLVVWMVRRRRA
jgi:CshA-type fibril repeat protein